MAVSEVDCPLKHVGVQSSGRNIILSRDNPHSAAAIKSLAKTHILIGIGLAGTGARN